MSLSFNVLDYFLILVIVVSAGYGAWRGFVSETLTIFAWAAAAFGTLYIGPCAVLMARSLIATHWLVSLAAYVGIFLVILLNYAVTLKDYGFSFDPSALGLPDGSIRAFSEGWRIVYRVDRDSK